ncbi:MAG: hypothetical protein ABSG81_16345 [Acidimicrobiales bacterium]
MIHVATVHVATARWIDVQLGFLRRNLPEPYKVYANLQDVPEGHAHKFDRVVPMLGEHAGKLNLLAAEIAAGAHDDDRLGAPPRRLVARLLVGDRRRPARH